MKKIFCAVLIVICLTGYAWTEATSETEGVVFAPQDLPKIFSDNPNEAKTQYMNKTVQIKGIVVDKGMSIYMTPYLAISENGKEPALARCVFPYIGIAYWNRSAQLDEFKIGQTVTISGRVHNLNENRVLLKDSKAVK
jgi:hypothetical protein